MNRTDENKYALNTTVRFYRSVEGVPFVERFSTEDAEDINYNVKSVCDSAWGEDDYDAINVNNTDKSDILYWGDENCCLVKTEPTRHARMLFCNRQGTVSIITNEAEHIMVQSKFGGYNINGAYKAACECVNSLSSRIPFAANERYGFVTANPWCSGTALKVSVLMHLPATLLLSKFGFLSDSMKTRGINIKSFFSDRRKPLGSLFQVTNVYTRNISESETVEAVADAVDYIADYEEDRRSELMGSKPNFVYDIVYRSLGITALARELDMGQFMLSISNIRLGSELGIMDFDADYVDELLFKGQVGYISRYRIRNSIENSVRDDVVRARIMREETAPLLKKLL